MRNPPLNRQNNSRPKWNIFDPYTQFSIDQTLNQNPFLKNFDEVHFSFFECNPCFGIFRSGNFYLAGSNTNGGGTVNAFTFGQVNDVPIAGDWTNSGTTTSGLFRSGTFFLASSNVNGGGDLNIFTFGQANDVPITGDWNEDGKTEVGLFRNGMVFLASSNIAGGGNLTTFNYAQTNDLPFGGYFG